MRRVVVWGVIVAVMVMQLAGSLLVGIYYTGRGCRRERLCFFICFFVFAFFAMTQRTFRAMSVLMLLLVGTQLYLSSCCCVEGEPSDLYPRVVGGEVVDPADRFPWMAMVTHRNYFICGGVLSSSNTVLTAAHCVDGVTLRDLEGGRLRVLVGLHDRLEQGGPATHVSRTVHSVGVHPLFDAGMLRYDLAVLFFQEAVEGVPLASLAFHEDPEGIAYSPPPGIVGLNTDPTYVLKVLGWGSTSYQGEASRYLLEGQLHPWSFIDCWALYGGFLLSDTHMCAGSATADSCSGDSGGPLLYLSEATQEWRVVALVSFGYECGHPDFPGVYGRLDTASSSLFVQGTIQAFHARHNLSFQTNIFNRSLPLPAESLQVNCSLTFCPQGHLCHPNGGACILSPGTLQASGAQRSTHPPSVSPFILLLLLRCSWCFSFHLLFFLSPFLFFPFFSLSFSFLSFLFPFFSLSLPSLFLLFPFFLFSLCFSFLVASLTFLLFFSSSF